MIEATDGNRPRGRSELSRRGLVAGCVLVASFADCTSGDRPGDRERTGEGSACAGKHGTITADVDGDGHRDLIWRGYVDRDAVNGTLVVGVCTANVSTNVAVGGMGEGEFHTIDIDQDGRSEIVSGGTTVSQRISEVVVLDAGRLVSIPDLSVSDGPAQFTEIDGRSVPSVVEQWGCEDFDQNGTRDLVQVSVTRQGGGATAHFEAYRIVGATARRVGSRDRVLDHMPDFNEHLVPSC